MGSVSLLIFFGVICEVMFAWTLWVLFLALRIHFNHYLFIRMLCNMSIDHLQVWRQTTAVTHLPWVVWSRTLRTTSLRLRVVSLRHSKLRYRLWHIFNRLMIVIEVNTIIDALSFLLNLLLSKLYGLSVFLILRCQVWRIKVTWFIQLILQIIGLRLIVILGVHCRISLELILYHVILIQSFRVISSKIQIFIVFTTLTVCTHILLADLSASVHTSLI